jgi:hypothetical protein
MEMRRRVPRRDVGERRTEKRTDGFDNAAILFGEPAFTLSPAVKKKKKTDSLVRRRQIKRNKSSIFFLLLALRFSSSALFLCFK